MELRENRTELERLLGGVWDYEEADDRKTSLPKWLFAFTLAGALFCTLSPKDIVAPVVTALVPAPEKLSIDTVSSENVAEDLDYRIARRANSLVGWRTFLDAHPDGPHAAAARAEIGQTQPAVAQSRTPDDAPQDTASVATSPSAEGKEAAPPPSQPVEAAEQSPPPQAATPAPDAAAQAPPPSVAGEEPPPPQPVEAAEQSPPAAAVTQTPGDSAQQWAPPVVADGEPTPASEPLPLAVTADPPLPPSRPKEIAAAKPARHTHLRADRRQAGQPNVLMLLVGQVLNLGRHDGMASR